MKTYIVTAERSGKWWAFSTVGVDNAFGQSKRLDHVEDDARGVIAMMTNVDRDSFEINLFTKEDPVTDEIVQTTKDARSELEELARKVNEQTRLAIQQLKSQAGLPVRDIGNLVGVSFQRVSQILNEPENDDAIGFQKESGRKVHF